MTFVTNGTAILVRRRTTSPQKSSRHCNVGHHAPRADAPLAAEGVTISSMQHPYIGRHCRNRNDSKLSTTPAGEATYPVATFAISWSAKCYPVSFFTQCPFLSLYGRFSLSSFT